MSLEPVRTRAIELGDLAMDARDFIAASRSENTDRSYRTGWAQFTEWCGARALETLRLSPRRSPCSLLISRRTAKPATIDARLARSRPLTGPPGTRAPPRPKRSAWCAWGAPDFRYGQRQVRPVTVVDLRKMVDGLGRDRVPAAIGHSCCSGLPEPSGGRSWSDSTLPT